MTPTLFLAQQLIACPSITPDDYGCQDIIRDRLSRLGFQCESLRFDEVDNLWAKLGDDMPLIVFAGHTDVVPPGPLADWTSPPFSPEVRDGYLFGRGAVDMKGAIAAMVVAVENFKNEYSNFKGSIGFLITSDEEGPSINGTQKVIEALSARGEKIDYCIIGEPSSDQKVGDQVRVGRRGSLHGNLTMLGKQGHVAHPHLATNPIHLSAGTLNELAQTKWDEGNEFYPPTTFQITNIHSGTGALNVIPGHLEVAFNFRYSTAVTVKELQERTDAILNTSGLTYHMNWKVGAEPFLTKNAKLITTTEMVIKEKTGLNVKLSTGGGTSDGRFIHPTGAEVVELGSLHATAHQVDECVAVADLQLLTDIYQAMLREILCHDVCG